MRTNKEKSYVQPESITKQTIGQSSSFGSSFISWCFIYYELVSNFKCHKLESCSSKNMLVEKLDEETSDLVYDGSNGSEEVS